SAAAAAAAPAISSSSSSSSSAATELQRIGPYFLREPPHSVTFSNNTGAVIYCSATGRPVPKVTWETANGQTISELTGLRHVRAHDGALVYEPFSGAEEYREEVHAAAVRCSAASTSGSGGSNTAVLKSHYVQVHA
ncbi:hypothetical protein TYRP_013852, partial [Tyrophagus putrescentiae]